MDEFHTPVLLKEVVEFLEVKPGRKYIDATVGGGGHSWEILKRGGVVLGLDVDSEAIAHVKQTLESRNFRILREEKDKVLNISVSKYPNITLVRGNFARLKEIAERYKFGEVSGVLFDLGVSAFQVLTPKRGFSFESDFPLDMRMDPDLAVTAADLVNGLNKGELYELFSKLGEEDDARFIAEAIVRARARRPIKTGRELAEIIVKVRPKHRFKKHPATRCFQALRIAVNDELNNLRKGLPFAVELLGVQGRLIAISFHSLEDRIVKRFLLKNPSLRILTRRPVRPSQEEVKRNPKSRSAKMRVAEKMDYGQKTKA
jgi:16S rRNA (cytosine1402-N4)-methyltransferase